MGITRLETNELIRAIVIIGILMFFGYLMSQTVGLGGGGFDTERVIQQFTFYTSGGLFLIIILCMIVGVMYASSESEYGDGVMFASQGEFPSLEYFKKFSTIRLIWLSTIIFLPLGIFALTTGQKTFTGLRVLEHQFTPIASILYSALLIPISENAGAAAFIGVTVFSLILIAKRYDWSRENYRLLILFFVPLLVGTYGYANHLLRYGTNEFNMFVVFIFWSVGGLITILTGSFMPFLMMHLMNNLLFDLKRFFDNDAIMSIFIFVFIIISIGYFYVYIFKGKGNHGKTKR